MGRKNSAPVITDARSFMTGSSGRWAGEQMLKALNEGRPLSTSDLRTADTLRSREWIYLDEALVTSALIRLKAVADLRAAGLTRPVVGGLGKTVYEYDKTGVMNPAAVSMDGMAKSDNDRVEFTRAALPLPIIHKDFYLNLRTLMASRTMGDPLDTTEVAAAGRSIAEMQEHMLFNGGPTFAGLPIYGYTTHPNISTQEYGAHGAWDETAVTGADILADVMGAIAKLESNRMFGPYAVYVPTAFSNALNNDFKSFGTITVKQRLEELDSLKQYGVSVADMCPEDKIVVVQMTSDVVVLVDAEPLQTIQWDIEGGFMINFKAFTVSVPLVRADVEGRSGICVVQPAA